MQQRSLPAPGNSFHRMLFTRKGKHFFFPSILHACPVSAQVVYLGACFSGINICSEMLGFGSCAFFLANSSGGHL